MTQPVDDPCGPNDVSWVVDYLTELLEMNFQALVADAETDGEADGETDSDEVPPETVSEVSRVRVKLERACLARFEVCVYLWSI